VEGGAAVNDISTGGDDGACSSVTQEHDVSLLLRNFHILSVNSSLYPNNKPLTTLQRSGFHGLRHRFEVSATVRRHHHIGIHRRGLKQAPVGTRNPLRPDNTVAIGIALLRQELSVLASVVVSELRGLFEVGNVGVGHVLGHGECVAAHAFHVHLSFFQSLPDALIGVLVREAVEARDLVGYGGADEGFEVVGVLVQSFLVGVELEIVLSLSQLVERLVDGFEAVVERRFLALREAAFGGELLDGEVVVLHRARGDLEGELDDVTVRGYFVGDVGF